MKVVMQPGQENEQLISEARNGNREAFNTLAERFRSSLQTIVEQRLGGYLRHKIEADDVVQESLFKAFQSIRLFEYRGPDSFLHWLRGIAENVLLYWARENKRKDLLPLLTEAAGKNVSPSKAMRQEERFRRLERAVSELSTDERQVILSARVEGLPMKEVAKRLNRSPAAVRQLLWRSLQKLRGSFGDTESFSLPQKSLINGSEGKERDDGE